jgi:hypothetical protein
MDMMLYRWTLNGKTITNIRRDIHVGHGDLHIMSFRTLRFLPTIVGSNKIKVHKMTKQQLSKERFSLEYRRFGTDPVQIRGHLHELASMARDLSNLGHIPCIQVRDSVTGRFVQYRAQ